MNFFVDGYNVIRSVDWLSGGALRDQRERLLTYIETRRPRGAREVTVVFDGRVDVWGPRWPGPTQVLFSSGKDADQVIKDSVDGLLNPREAVVVTNDRAIQRWVKAVGAKIVSCEEFLAAVPRRDGLLGRPVGGREGRRPAVLSGEDVESINSELRGLWKLK